MNDRAELAHSAHVCPSGFPPPEAAPAYRSLKRTLADEEDAANGVAVTSAFRERLASRQRRQRAQQQQQEQQQQWGNWRRESPGVNSFYPAGSPGE